MILCRPVNPMKVISYFLVLFLSILALTATSGQDTLKNWDLGGYVKYLHSAFLMEESSIQTNQLIHNRLNFKWYPDEKFTLNIEARNRALWGDLVKLIPDYHEIIDETSQDLLDLGLTLVEGRGFLLHTYLDRAFLEYQSSQWKIRAGRQRINWGINTIWNPNDIFNAYSFVDFDYEERPGTDALRVQYNYSFASLVELVIRPGNESSDYIFGALWRFNYSLYDFQLLVAQSPGEFILGAGWAGNLGQWGWKGEVSYFLDDDQHSIALSSGLDYTFINGAYLGIGYLYNSLGSLDSGINELFNTQLSAKNLYPYNHSILAQYTYLFTPILSGNISVIYSPNKRHPAFLVTSLTYSILENWDIDLVSQVAFNKNEQFSSPVQSFFGRLKYSF